MDKPKNRQGRRPRGSGSIFWSGSRQLWIGRVPCGKTKGGYTKYQELSDASQGKLLARLKQLKPPGADTTLKEWAERWHARSTARDSTRDGYGYTLKNFIIPTFGHWPVASLTTEVIEVGVQQWLTRVEAGTVRLYMGQLRNMLNSARRAGLCSVNPASDVRTPKPHRRPIAPLAPEDLARIVSVCQHRAPDYPIALLAATGMRVGEALALDVADWDAVAGTVAITKTWTRRHGTRPPKSEQGYRTIRVPESARPAIQAAIGGRLDGPVFVVWDGRNRRYHESVRNAFDVVLKRLGLPRRNLHQLRHSVGSGLCAAGVPLADLARFLGDRVETIVSTYLHAGGSDPSRTMDELFRSGRARKRG